MNVGAYLKPDLHSYGQFNVHYFFRNIQSMLFAVPIWNSNCGFWSTPRGLSIFITTPALVYLYRAWKHQPWVWGAWTSVALLLIPLLFYFNTGNEILGYRFLMDLIIPLMALLALAAGEYVSGAMRLLILGGIIVNYLGLLWFFTGLCS